MSIPISQPAAALVGAPDGVVASREGETEAELRRELERLRHRERELLAEVVPLRQAVQGAGLATWEWDPSSGLVVANRRFAEMLGYEPHEVGDLFELWKSSLHPDDASRVLARLALYLAGGSRPYQVEYRLRHRDGHWLWVVATGRALAHGADGRVLRMCGAHLDVSDVKQLEAERFRLERLLVATVDSTKDLIWSVDAERFRIVTFNRAIQEFLRTAYGRELRVGMEVAEASPTPEIAERWTRWYERALREGSFSLEYETTGKHLEVHFSRLARQGTPYGVAVFCRDVTEEHRALERLRRSEAFFRAVQEASPDLAAVIGEDGKYGFVSAAWLGVLGHTVPELRASAPLDLVHPDDAPRLERALERVKAGKGAVQRGRYRMRHQNGSWRVLDMVARNELENPAVAGVLVNARDVTDQVELAARLQQVREEEKTRIARDLHDELGQLLTALKLDLSWIEERLEELTPSAQLNAIVDRLVAASVVCEQTVTEIQRIATDLRPAALDRLGLAAALRQDARRFEARAGVPCRVELAEPLPRLPAATSTALYRISQEALTNVARHARATEVVIRLHAARGQVVLAVEDDGMGLDGAGATRRLGLAGMRERAALEGGELVLSRRPGGGTRVAALLPLHAPAEARR